MNNTQHTEHTSRAIVVEHMRKQYSVHNAAHTAITVLDDISFSIAEGMRTVITGESGSGKTTLLSLLSGLDTCDAGTVSLHGTEITQLKERERARFRLQNIGFVFQYHYLLQDFSALGNVMLPLLMIGTGTTIAKKEALNMLAFVGLSERAHHKPIQLSGGECQRVAIARALVHSPRIVLADEPTGSLDTKNSEHLRNILCSLAQEKHTTLIIATHDRDFISIADAHFHLQDGTISLAGNTTEVESSCI